MRDPLADILRARLHVRGDFIKLVRIDCSLGPYPVAIFSNTRGSQGATIAIDPDEGLTDEYVNALIASVEAAVL